MAGRKPIDSPELEPATRYFSHRLCTRPFHHHCQRGLRQKVRLHRLRNGGPNTGLCMFLSMPSCSRTHSTFTVIRFDRRGPINSPKLEPATRCFSDDSVARPPNHHCPHGLRPGIRRHRQASGGPNTGLCMFLFMPSCSRTHPTFTVIRFD